ncbi:ATP-dependent DNA helicase, partial [Pseudomonas aeruginosa]|nr:ATP-dependent DNA helicase [Pseudomonas aeruginosa]
RKPLADRRPGLDLGRRGRGEVAFEPLADGGMELRQGPRSRLGAAGGRG